MVTSIAGEEISVLVGAGFVAPADGIGDGVSNSWAAAKTRSGFSPVMQR
jgi:hypothetical protein